MIFHEPGGGTCASHIY